MNQRTNKTTTQKQFLTERDDSVYMHLNNSHLFEDQYAFRPTGSTTATLIYLLQTLTELLQIHDYVHVIARDFSKAFDSVRHRSLVSKLANFIIPDYLHNWMVDNLFCTQHQTKLSGEISSMLAINASIIPVSYTHLTLPTILRV